MFYQNYLTKYSIPRVERAYRIICKIEDLIATNPHPLQFRPMSLYPLSSKFIHESKGGHILVSSRTKKHLWREGFGQPTSPRETPTHIFH